MTDGVSPLPPISGPELFFGLIAPVGTDLNSVYEQLCAELKKVGYEPFLIRLSDLLSDLPDFQYLSIYEYEDRRIESRMDAGTQFRKGTSSGSILAQLGIMKVRDYRLNSNGKCNQALPRKAYIFHQLKHPQEVDLLREVYGRLFFVISAYSPRGVRVSNLATRISNSYGEAVSNHRRGTAESLVNKDEKEEGQKLGQDVTDAFPLADFFVDASHPKYSLSSIQRFVEIIFGYPFHTPNKDELSMFYAKSVSLRSADLARQVGASICDSDGNIISNGCNEVPKFGGGAYWPGEHDERDYIKGFDANDHHKDNIKRQLKSRGLERIKEMLRSVSSDSLTANIDEDLIVFEDFVGEFVNHMVSKSQIDDLLEFGRPVHAEMLAITHASKLGRSTHMATLYCTTFPCHMCARHIISAGIDRVVYIEPYPKSRVENLYGDAVAVEPQQYVPNKVNFTPFVGVSPYRFQELFSFGKKERKTNGEAVRWEAHGQEPRVKRIVSTYLNLEAEIALSFRDTLHGNGYALDTLGVEGG